MRENRFIRQRRPTAPGEVLREEFLAPRGMTVSGFAEHVGLSRKHVSDIVNERARVTPATAVLFAHAFATTPAFWLNLQGAADLWDAEQTFAASSGAVPELPKPLPPAE